MLDVLLPISIPNVDLVPEALELLERFTDVPARVIAIVDGGHRQDFAVAESALRGGSLEWVLLHEESPHGLNHCIGEAVEAARHPFVAFMQPHVRLSDSKWFGKMQQVLLADQTTGIIDTIPNTMSSSQAPVKRQVHRMPDPGCALALLTGRFFTGSISPPGNADPVSWWARQAINNGGSCWHAGGVHYTLIEHTPHPLQLAWQEPSESPNHRESPSPTTPASSTRTTTGKAGSTDFEL